MAVNNPLRLGRTTDTAQGSANSGLTYDLRKLSDAELDNLTKTFRLAYAKRLQRSARVNVTTHQNNYGTNLANGYDYDYNENLVPGTLHGAENQEYFWRDQFGNNHPKRSVGSLNNRYYSNSSTSRADNDTGGAGNEEGTGGEDYADDPDSPSLITLGQFFCWQSLPKQNVHKLPDANTLRTFGYAVANSDGDIKMEGDISNIIDSIFKQSNNEMLNGDQIGLYKIATSTPGDTWVYMSSGGSNSYIFRDLVSDSDHAQYPGGGSVYADQNYYYLYLNLGENSSSSWYNSAQIYSQNEPIRYSNYVCTMQSGTALKTVGNNIDDFFLEGTYKGTVYIKAHNVNASTIKWSTNNSSYTNIATETTPQFNTTNPRLGINNRSIVFYPSGNSSDGYCRVWLHAASEMSTGYDDDAGFGSGLYGDPANSTGGDYNTTNVYKFEYSPGIHPHYFANHRRHDVWDSPNVHDPDVQANTRRNALIYNVLLPIYEGYHSTKTDNCLFPRYSWENTNTGNGTTKRHCGTIIDSIRSTESIRSNYLSNGTYYNIRYQTGNPEAFATKYLIADASNTGVR